VTKWRFSILYEKCQIGDVTVGGGRVVSTSGYLFPVGHHLNRSICCGAVFENYYFRYSERLKIIHTRICTFLAILPLLVTRKRLALEFGNWDRLHQKVGLQRV